MTRLAANARQQTLDLIQQAQSLLNQATATASNLREWREPWMRIDAHAEATKQLWHAVDKAPLPSELDSEKPFVATS